MPPLLDPMQQDEEKDAQDFARRKRVALAKGSFLHRKLSGFLHVPTIKELYSQQPGDTEEDVRARTRLFLQDLFVSGMTVAKYQEAVTEKIRSYRTADLRIVSVYIRRALPVFFEWDSVCVTGETATSVCVIPTNEPSPRRTVLLDDESKTVLKIYTLDKVTPRDMLHDTYLSNMNEVVNEVQIGSTLNELSDAYAHVVTPHFAYTLDWFIAPRITAATPGTGHTGVEFDRDQRCLFVVSERGEQTLSDLFVAIRRKTEGMFVRGFGVLRSVLFQVIFSMYAAYLTHGFVHFDMHSGNVMLRTVGPSSPYHGKIWRYKALGNAEHYYLLPSEHEHTFVEIIDYGRARIWAPGPDEGTATVQADLGKTGESAAPVLLQYNIAERNDASGVNSLNPDPCHSIRNLAYNILLSVSITQLAQVNRVAKQEVAEMGDLLANMLDMEYFTDYVFPGNRFVGTAVSPSFATRLEKESKIALRYFHMWWERTVTMAKKPPSPGEIFLSLNTLLFSTTENAGAVIRQVLADASVRYGVFTVAAHRLTRMAARNQAGGPNSMGACLAMPIFARYSGLVEEATKIPSILNGMVTPDIVMKDPVRGKATAAWSKPRTKRQVINSAPQSCLFCGDTAVTIQGSGPMEKAFLFCGIDCAHAMAQEELNKKQ